MAKVLIVAQFDVYKGSGEFPFLLDVQADLLQRLTTRMVVPLVAKKKHGRPIARLNPIAAIGRVEYQLLFQEMAAVPTSLLTRRVDSLAHRRPDLLAALDLLFTGS